MAKKKSSFRGKVARNAQEQKPGGAQYGYLKLPRGVNVFSPEAGGRSLFDNIPYYVSDARHPDRNDERDQAQVGDLWYKRPFKIHRNIGVSNDAVICLTSVGKRCPICDYRAQQIKEGASKDITDALKISIRNLYVVIPLEDKKYEEKPHIFDISQFLFQNLLTDELMENEKYEVFPDLEEGFTLRVRWDSKTIGVGKPFAEASRIDFDEREPYNEDIIDPDIDLDAIIRSSALSTAQLEQKFFEMDDIPEDTESEETEPDDVPDPPSKPGRRSRRKETEEVEEEEESPVEEEKKEKKKAEKKKKKDPDACIACEGSGKDSKGKTCRICRGTGKKKQKEEKTEEERCPHDHTFGVDTEDYDECFNCDLWDECMDKKEE